MGVCVPHVMASADIRLRPLNWAPASIISDVRPERDIKTVLQSRGSNSGNNKISDAGIAREGPPVISDQDADAASAR
ncbi:MAG TPA: hypothetical protein VJR23_18050 [Candidatus Acidoferrales bacterium]|nr:hypothetical protein [Candidatus Acidoferrales bacterium]